MSVNGKDQISLIWCIEDVKGRDIDWPEEGVAPLTDDECRQVLANVERHHDASIGVTWDTIDYEIEQIRNERNEK